VDAADHAVGPDLAPYAVKPPQALLIAVIDPNQAVDNRYVSYSVATTDGRILSGILEGKKEVILRSEIEELHATGKSLMPEGMERDLTRADLADLIAYVGGLAAPPKQFDGNNPQVVRPGADGSLALAANVAAIYGGDIVFEPEFRNIGMWHGETDLAAWSFELAADGQYDVLLEYACHDSSAGNQFQLEAQGSRLEGKIAGTGGWDRYTQLRLGRLSLRKGNGRLTFRSAGPIQGALVDLRQVTLTLAPAE
jgi:putative heme-binding domain-containing protein